MGRKREIVFKSEEGRKAILAKYDEILERWPGPRKVLDIPTRHGGTRAVCSGPEGAPAVVFLHGSTSNAMSWIAEAGVFSRSFRVVALDIPGEPGWSEPCRFAWSGAEPEEWLSDALDGLGLGRVSLCGMSLGSWMSLSFAARRPGRVERMALLCPPGLAPTRASFLLKSILNLPRGRKGVERVAGMVYGGSTAPKEAVDYTILMGQAFQPRMEAPPVFSDAELARVACPVLLIAGLRDPLIRSRATADRLERLLPDFRAELIPEAGHVLLGHGERLAAFFAGRG